MNDHQIALISRGGNDIGLSCSCRKVIQAARPRYPLIALRTRWTVPEALGVWQAWHARQGVIVS